MHIEPEKEAADRGAPLSPFVILSSNYLPKTEAGCDSSHRSQRPLGTILSNDEAVIVLSRARNDRSHRLCQLAPLLREDGSRALDRRKGLAIFRGVKNDHYTINPLNEETLQMLPNNDTDWTPCERGTLASTIAKVRSQRRKTTLIRLAASTVVFALVTAIASFYTSPNSSLLDCHGGPFDFIMLMVHQIV